MFTFVESMADSFDYIFKLYYKRVFFYAKSYLHDDEAARDIAEEAFIAYWNNIDRIETDALHYLIVVAKRRCLNSIRDSKKLSSFDKQIETIAIENSSIEKLLVSEVEDQYHKSLKKMPPKTREAFLMSREQGRTYKEIAESQGVGVKDIEYRIMSALRILRKDLKNFLPLALGFLLLSVFN